MTTALLGRLLPIVAMLSSCRCAPEVDTSPENEVDSVEYTDARLGGSRGRLLNVRRDGVFEFKCEANPPSRFPDGCRENEIGVYRGRLPRADSERLFRLLSSPPPATLPTYDEHLSILAPGRGRRLFTIVTRDASEERLLGSIAVPAALERVAQELDHVVDIACQQPVAVLRLALEEIHLEGRTRLVLTMLATNPGTTPIFWEAPNEQVQHRAGVFFSAEHGGRSLEAIGAQEEVDRSPSVSQMGDIVELPPRAFVRFRAIATFPSLQAGRTHVLLEYVTGSGATDPTVTYGAVSVRGEVLVP